MAKTGRWQGGTIAGRTSPRPSPVVLPDRDVDVTARGRVRVGGVELQPGVVHDWSREGWGPWREQVINLDSDAPSDRHVLSVANGRGRIAQPGTGGNMRFAYERNGTGPWLNSEVLCLWYGANRFDTGGSNPATPQAGQFHRGYVDENGDWRGVVVTNNIFLTDVNVINQNVWNHDQAASIGNGQLLLGTRGGSMTLANADLRRDLRVLALRRVDLFGKINQYRVEPRHLYGLTTTEAATVDVDEDATFDVASAATVAGADAVQGIVSMADAEAGSDVAWKFDTGLVIPDSATARRYWPYWVRSQLVDRILRVKVWRWMDPEPDWSDSRHVVVQDFSRTSVVAGQAGDPEPAARWPDAAGTCGVVGAHIRNTRYLEYGYFGAWRLP